MRKRLALALAAATVSSLSLFSPADATHSWGSYHWARTANPLTLQVGNNVSAAWATHFTESVGDWNASSVLELQVVSGSSGRRCGAVSGTVQVCNGSYGYNGWLGLATISISGSHITQGTAKMNDTYFALPAYNNDNEKLHVMCQEIGHTFGLGHTSEDGSSQGTCMDYSSDSGSTRPNQHDYDQLVSIYGSHLDSAPTGGGKPGKSRAEVGDERSSWGAEVARGANGEFSLFERDFGDGEKVLTHVRWADDAQAGARGRHRHAE